MKYDDLLWGKSDPFCALSWHMIAVGACGLEYLLASSSRWLLELLSEWMGIAPDQVPWALAYVFSLHDIGKAHPSFQIPNRAAAVPWRERGFAEACVLSPERFRHEEYSYLVLKRLWEHGAAFPGKDWKTFATTARLHHQGKGKSDNRNEIPEMWHEIQDDVERRMRSLFLREERPAALRNLDALGVLVTAALILSDWVASSRDFGDSDGDMDDASYLSWARRRAKEVLSKFGLISDAPYAFPGDVEFCAFWPEIPRKGMRPLQELAERLGSVPALLTIIEGPMGEGKTEAALYIAGQLCRIFGKRGVYVALPTSATSNQMYGRVRKMLELHGAGGVRLLHSAAWLLDERTPGADIRSEDAEQASDWLRPLRRGMLSENAVGTVDQAMAAVLKLKYGMLRLEGLAGKVLIIDEIHAYDVYMSEIIEMLLKWCRILRVPVILLSATLQRRQKEKYIRCFCEGEFSCSDAYPLISQVTADGALRQSAADGTYMRTAFRFRTLSGQSDTRSVAELALKRVKDGGRLCVMMNTVRRAREVYETIKEKAEGDVMLFHARFREWRRAELEKACIERFGKDGVRPPRMILVCTQVVEQSLDVDFDGMITDLAPIDLLLQRAGRVHRHRWLERPAGMQEPDIWVLLPEGGDVHDLDARYRKTSSIYPSSVLWGTEKVLGEGRVIRVPEDVRACVEEAYEYFDEDAIEAYIRKQVADQMDASEALGAILPKPREDIFFAEVPSLAEQICLDDHEGLNAFSRVRTRNGEQSVRIAFLPADFGPLEEGLDGAKKILSQSVSIRLTKEIDGARIAMKRDLKIVNDAKIRDCIILRPEADGTYRIGDVVFVADDELGIWWEGKK